MADIAKLVEELSQLTVLEAADLAKALEEAWGVSAAAAVAVAAAPAGDAGAAVEEKTEFDVILTGDGGKKIQVIKEVRAITGLGLAEAKALSKALPRLSRKASTRPKPKTSRRRSKKPAAPSSSSNPLRVSARKDSPGFAPGSISRFFRADREGRLFGAALSFCPLDGPGLSP